MNRNCYVYFAGPDVFRPNAIDYFNVISQYINKKGIVGIFPISEQIKTHEGIFAENIHSLHMCDYVLANLDSFHGVSLDVGTAFEIGYAKALKKPIIAYYTNGIPKDLKSRVTWGYLNKTYTEIEDFNLTDNLMIINACEYIGNNIYETIDYLYKRMNNI